MGVKRGKVQPGLRLGMYSQQAERLKCVYVTPPRHQWPGTETDRDTYSTQKSTDCSSLILSPLEEQDTGLLVATDIVALSQKGALVLIDPESCQHWTLDLQLPRTALPGTQRRLSLPLSP